MFGVRTSEEKRQEVHKAEGGGQRDGDDDDDADATEEEVLLKALETQGPGIVLRIARFVHTF